MGPLISIPRIVKTITTASKKPGQTDPPTTLMLMFGILVLYMAGIVCGLDYLNNEIDATRLSVIMIATGLVPTVLGVTRIVRRRIAHGHPIVEMPRVSFKRLWQALDKMTARDTDGTVTMRFYMSGFVLIFVSIMLLWITDQNSAHIRQEDAPVIFAIAMFPMVLGALLVVVSIIRSAR
ncbi:hypothetical protein HOI83_02110 [Candidatus Uhrbacteria bacterium]|jgi:hypothetical protein|nr:hypothetical protein [Candidatus Uhrbacteria bacterium]